MNAPCVIDDAFARRFAAEWMAAWNAHDLDRVLAHYRDDFSFRSPMITIVTGDPSGQLQGKAAVRAYWAAALQRLPQLRFELCDVLLGADCLTLYYRGHRGLVAETFFFDANGRVASAAAAYSLDS
ncbi:SnoaL-like protein [Fluviicoccus keumensis]|uniref:SnoaL-like protein n=1 Tax=Fluviicoccus keumensis TaxID=1435465 RepID=A0A4Q7ZBM0_9GAMM|nr:nuclear transport factor 2 family protein [Fluviicoccus keumensis]RZU47990.1 SnoaL-like protein [Fluviicoccus keumensis]